MKRVLSVSLVLAMMLSLMVALAGCGEKTYEEKIPETFINETLEFALTDPMPV